MRTLGFLIVLGAVGYYALMNPAVISQLTRTAPVKEQSAQSIQQEAKDNKEAVVEEQQGENGDHLFEGLTG